MGVAAIVTAIVISLGVSCNGFREDEIECEQAVVHLRDCCPGFKASAVDCSYSEETGCDNVTHYTFPAISIADSQCLQQKSCAELVDGYCAQAQSAQRRAAMAPAPAPACARNETALARRTSVTDEGEARGLGTFRPGGGLGGLFSHS